MYITFQQYTGNGGTITDAAAFARYERRAEMAVNYYTQNRLTAQPDTLLPLMVELIELIARADSRVLSTSNDGVSVTYRDGAAAYDQNAANLVRQYLPEYCYRGYKYE